MKGYNIRGRRDPIQNRACPCAMLSLYDNFFLAFIMQLFSYFSSGESRCSC